MADEIRKRADADSSMRKALDLAASTIAFFKFLLLIKQFSLWPSDHPVLRQVSLRLCLFRLSLLPLLPDWGIPSIAASPILHLWHLLRIINWRLVREPIR